MKNRSRRTLRLGTETDSWYCYLIGQLDLRNFAHLIVRRPLRLHLSLRQLDTEKTALKLLRHVRNQLKNITTLLYPAYMVTRCIHKYLPIQVVSISHLAILSPLLALLPDTCGGGILCCLATRWMGLPQNPSGPPELSTYFTNYVSQPN